MDPVIPGLPDVIGRHYQVVARVGTGGMGVVYKAIDTRLNRAVAIKSIHDRRLLDARDRLRSEALAAASLDHPYICKVYELIEDGSETYLVMEYVDGETLSSILKRRAPSITETVQLGCEIVEGLAAAHARGLVHRDVKPSNVMVTSHGHVKLLDFGLAQDDPVSTPGDETRTPPSRHGSHAGTPHYMAPEQAVGEPVTARADLFSTGVVLFECLAGKLPFAGSSPYDYVRHLLSDDPRPLDRLAPTAPVDLVRLVERCLAKTPANRPASATEMLNELRRIAGGLTATGGILPTAAAARQTRRWQLVALLAVLTVAASVAWIWFGSRPPAETLRQSRPFVNWASETGGSRVSPDGRWVSFVSARGGVMQLLAQSVDGTDAQSLMLGPGVPRTHVWSPDGREIAVVIRRADRTELIVVPAFFGGEPRVRVAMDEFPEVRALRWIGHEVFLQVADGRNPRSLRRADLEQRSLQLASTGWKLPGELRSFDVSPDGRRVVYALASDGREDLWESAIDGSGLARLTNDEYFERQPIWNGHGSTVLYQSNRGGPVDLWELALGTGRATQLTSSDTEETPGGTSTDGSLISFHQDSEEARLWQWNARTREGQPLGGDESSDFSPSVSNDSRLVAFHRQTPSPSSGFLILDSKLMLGELGAAGWTARPQPRVNGFAGVLSPDGTHLAFMERGAALGAVTLKVRQLTSDRDITVSTNCRLPILSPFPIEWGEHNVAWSASGDVLYFVEHADPEVIRRYAIGGAAAGEAVIAAASGEIIRDVLPSRDGRSLAYLTLLRGEFVLRSVDLQTRAVREWGRGASRRITGVFGRVWLRNDTALAIVRTVDVHEDNSADVEALVAGSRGLERIAFVTHARLVTARIDPSGSTMYITRIEKGVYNIYSIALPGGDAVPFTSNTLEGVSFSAVTPAGGDRLLGVRHEQRRTVWLIHTRPGG